MIEVEKVSKTLDKRTILKDVSLRVKRGEIFALLGPNGAGKTTLIYIISGLMKPNSGKVLISGLEASDNKARKKRAVLFQGESLDFKLTVYENLEVFSSLYGISPDSSRKKIEKYLKKLELLKFRDNLVKTLSGGIRKRVEIARALSVEAENLILDEPSLGLDPRAREILISELPEQAKKASVLLSTNNMDIAERCSRIAILHRGRVILEGKPGELLKALPEETLKIVPKNRRAIEVLEREFEKIIRVKNKIVVLTESSEEALDTLARVKEDIDRVEIKTTSLAELFLLKTGTEIPQPRIQAGRKRRRGGN